MNKALFTFILALAALVLLSGCLGRPVSVCPNTICEIGEDRYNCPQDCGYPPQPRCVAEGEEGNAFTEVCCKDLTKIEDCSGPGFTCECQDGRFVCTQCGNGTCGKGENPCNCPEDCERLIDEPIGPEPDFMEWPEEEMPPE